MSQTTDSAKRAAATAAEQDAAAAEVSADIVARASGGLGFITCLLLSFAAHAGLLLTTSVSDIKNLAAGKPMVSPVSEDAKKPPVDTAKPPPTPPAPGPASTAKTPPAATGPGPAETPTSAGATSSDSPPAGTKPNPYLDKLNEKAPPITEPPKAINLGNDPDIGIK